MMKIDCIQEAIEEAEEIGKIKLIKDLLKDNEITTNKAAEYLLYLKYEIETISEITKLPIEEIKNIKEIYQHKDSLIPKGDNIFRVDCVREAIAEAREKGIKKGKLIQ